MPVCNRCGYEGDEDEFNEIGECTDPYECDESYHENYEEDEDMPIRHSNPSLKMKGSDPLKFGFELEVEVNRGDRQDVADELLTKMGGFDNEYLWCKGDPSLSHGFEIASHPFDWAWWKENHTTFAPIFTLPSKGVRSQQTNTCGLHVHMSRDGFRTAQHLYRFMKFIYDNPKLSKKIAGRKSGDMDRWGSLRRPDNIPECRCNCPTCEGRRRTKDGLLAKAEGVRTDGRYSAVNTNPQNTIEVRMFKGTLNKMHFYANMEYLHSAYEFSKTRAHTDMTVELYKKFIKGTGEEYPNLAEFMERKGI